MVDIGLIAYGSSTPLINAIWSSFVYIGGPLAPFLMAIYIIGCIASIYLIYKSLISIWNWFGRKSIP